jgi:hypothetical protein
VRARRGSGKSAAAALQAGMPMRRHNAHFAAGRRSHAWLTIKWMPRQQYAGWCRAQPSSYNFGRYRQSRPGIVADGFNLW